MEGSAGLKLAGERASPELANLQVLCLRLPGRGEADIRHELDLTTTHQTGIPDCSVVGEIVMISHAVHIQYRACNTDTSKVLEYAIPSKGKFKVRARATSDQKRAVTLQHAPQRKLLGTANAQPLTTIDNDTISGKMSRAINQSILSIAVAWRLCLSLSLLPRSRKNTVHVGKGVCRQMNQQRSLPIPLIGGHPSNLKITVPN